MARRPVNQPYTITTTFGVPDSYALFGNHSGVDYAVVLNSPVYAPVAGKVVYARNHSVRGKMVVIFDGKYYHRLMHNNAFNVAEGDQVAEGQQVALSGSTGLSTGPHVHWDINTRGVDAKALSDFIDPDKWLTDNQKGGDDVSDKIDSNDDVDRLYLNTYHRYPESDEVRKHWIGLTWEEALDKAREQPEYLDQNHKLLVRLPQLEKQAQETSVGVFEQVTEPLYRKVNK